MEYEADINSLISLLHDREMVTNQTYWYTKEVSMLILVIYMRSKFVNGEKSSETKEVLKGMFPTIYYL